MKGPRTDEPLPVALASLMAQRGMSVTDLWVAAGLESPSVVYHYLRGIRGRVVTRQSAETLRRISRSLGVPFDYWLEARIYLAHRVMVQYPDLLETHYDELMQAAEKRGFKAE